MLFVLKTIVLVSNITLCLVPAVLVAILAVVLIIIMRRRYNRLLKSQSGFFTGISQLLSLHGQNKDAFAKTQLGSWEYDIIGPWYKCNMTDIMAGIGLAQLKRYPGMLERRKHIIGVYDAAIDNLNNTLDANHQVQYLNHYDDDYQASGHLYITRLLGRSDQERREVIVKMAERGIACNVHYKPLPMMTAYKALGFDIKDYPNAYNLYLNEVTLPLHTRLSDDDVEYVITNFVDIVSKL